MTKKMLSVIGVVAAGAMMSAASAQINTVGPFVGDASEGFEGPQVIFTACMPDRVFGNTADLCTPTGNGCHTTTGWGFRCTIPKRSGTYFFGSAGGYAQYTFDTPVTSFGGYFGTNAYLATETAGADVIFYDASGSVIDTLRLDILNDCSWIWNGWESTGAAIATIDVVGDLWGGAYIMMDDMEYAAGSADCLTMTVSNLVAGSSADWDVSGATVGERVAVVYGHNDGTTAVNGTFGYCATFDIKGVNASQVICQKNADAAGEISCSKTIPAGASGVRVLSQAAERNTCPDECVSNLDDQVIS